MPFKEPARLWLGGIVYHPALRMVVKAALPAMMKALRSGNRNKRSSRRVVVVVVVVVEVVVVVVVGSSSSSRR